MNKYIKTLKIDGEVVDVFMGASIIIKGLEFGIDLINTNVQTPGELALASAKLGALGIHLGNESKYPSLDDVLSKFSFNFLIQVAIEIQKTFELKAEDLPSEKKNMAEKE